MSLRTVCLLVFTLSFSGLGAAQTAPAEASPRRAADLTLEEWRDWAEAYLETLPHDQRVAGLEPFGSIAGERTAMANAQRLFRERLGRAAADAEQPYRAHRLRNLWVVVGARQPPGEGLLLVLTRDAGAVVRLQLPPAALDG
jgi:hypothetical protein